MKNWLLGGLYLFVALSSLSGVLFGGAAFFLYRFYDDRDPSRAVICEKSGGTAPECAMPESADKVLDALITCGIDFFDVLKEEKAAFLHVRKVFHVNSYGDGQHRETNVIFRQPIEAYGLRLTGYTHSASIPAFIWKPTRYSWGFQVTGLPEEAARAIEMRHPQIEKFKEFLAPGYKRVRLRRRPASALFSIEMSPFRERISSARPEKRFRRAWVNSPRFPVFFS